MYLIDIQPNIINLAEIPMLIYHTGQLASSAQANLKIELNYLRVVVFGGVLDGYYSHKNPRK